MATEKKAKKVQIEVKAAPKWWGEAKNPPAVKRWYEYTIACVDGVFALEVDEERAGEIRARIVKELPVDDSEKESEAKPVRAAGRGKARRGGNADVPSSDKGAEGGSSSD